MSAQSESILPDEPVVVDVLVTDGRFLVTPTRLRVLTGRGLALDLPFDDLRRIQFDIERDRPATMVIVPDNAALEPQVLAVPDDAIRLATEALAIIGTKISGS